MLVAQVEGWKPIERKEQNVYNSGRRVKADPEKEQKISCFSRNVETDQEKE